MNPPSKEWCRLNLVSRLGSMYWWFQCNFTNKYEQPLLVFQVAADIKPRTPAQSKALQSTGCESFDAWKNIHSSQNNLQICVFSEITTDLESMLNFSVNCFFSLYIFTMSFPEMSTKISTVVRTEHDAEVWVLLCSSIQGALCSHTSWRSYFRTGCLKREAQACRLVVGGYSLVSELLWAMPSDSFAAVGPSGVIAVQTEANVKLIWCSTLVLV